MKKNTLMKVLAALVHMEPEVALPESYKILIVTKDTADLSDSFLAQGGICVQRDEDDHDSFMEDTLKAGHYENKREAVDVMIRESREVIQDLLAAGVEFDKSPSGDFAYTKEAAHSKARILHALAIALRHGIQVKDMSFVQVHPTSLYTKKPGRAFLISEAVRGEGAILLDKKGNRFVDELLPRDQVTEAIYAQM